MDKKSILKISDFDTCLDKGVIYWMDKDDILSQETAATVEDCRKFCTGHSGCQAAVYYQGSCYLLPHVFNHGKVKTLKKLGVVVHNDCSEYQIHCTIQ